MTHCISFHHFIIVIILMQNIYVIHPEEGSFQFTLSDTCKFNHINCNKDELEYLAISELHDQIDDDKNGDIDISESKDFVKESLPGSQSAEKAQKFHKADAHIDKQDLWNIWRSNEAYNWTTNDLVNWLVSDVELPQYVNSFKKLKLNGSSISRLTGIDFLTNVVKIHNDIHRRKIMIKAVDLVLFGSQKKYQMTNAFVIGMFSFFIIIITYLYIQNIYSKRFVKTMQTKLTDLSKADENVTELRNKLKVFENIKNQKDDEIQRMTEKHKHEINRVLNSSRESLCEDYEKVKAQQEILRLRAALDEAQMHINHLKKSSMSVALNSEPQFDNHCLYLLLQLTHAIEIQYLSEKIASIDRQSAEFRELNEKIKKKKSAFMGSFRVIHSTDMDDIEKGFAATKRAYEKVIFDKKEQVSRWNQIENITGFNLSKTVDANSLRQMLHCHVDSTEHQRRECNSVPLFSSNTDLSEISSTYASSDIHGTPKSEVSIKMVDNSTVSSTDLTDHHFVDSNERIENRPVSSQSTEKLNEDMLHTKRSRRDHTDKKRNILKMGRSRIPSLTRNSIENTK